MTPLSNRPVNMLFVEFDELYARHLCRHSQTGINVMHLLSLFALWYGVYGLLHWQVPDAWVLAVPAAIYLSVVALNVPARVFVATALFIVLILAAVWNVPAPWWACLLIIPASYKLQNLSHKFYTVESDMSLFNKKYKKGSSTLFVVLLIHEVPIVMQVLLFATRPAPAVVGVPTCEESIV